MPFQIPIVFLIFRRPTLTAQVFDAIRAVQPKKLFLIADGPCNEEESHLCDQVKNVVAKVDWDCETLHNYASENMGCRRRISSGLNWVFEEVDEAIILEDDCLPHPSFFHYCEELLNYYRNDERVMVISGNNFQDGKRRNPYSYYFSKYNHCWGWATWRRAWKHWTFDDKKWLEFRDLRLINSICGDVDERRYWTHIFNKLFLEGIPDSWAYAWTFSCWIQGGITALPNVNLVSNIGFGEGATHTKTHNNLYADMATKDIGKIHHPPFLVVDKEADSYTFNTHFGGLQTKRNKRLQSKIKRRIQSLANTVFS